MYFIKYVLVTILVSLVVTSIRCENFFTERLRNFFTQINTHIRNLPLACKFTECCSDEYISPDINKLDHLLSTELYGQQIVHNVIINALQGHLSSHEPPKALTMSFHGPPGTGKTYVAQMIARSIYKMGIHSQFYHFFNGRNDFPFQKDVEQYKEELRNIITTSLQRCERSMFIFDEVDKMPEGLLNILVPFMDYNTWLKSWRHSSLSINTRKAIYIFLSNTGSSRITQRLLSLWGEGKQRHMTKLQDFETLISVGAFNERGGFYHSDTIDTSVIDHYVPFLPLGEEHIRNCLKKSFINRGVTPTDDMIQEGLSYVTFGPPPHNLYATAGCKRLEQKVAAIIYNQKKRTEF